MAKSGLRPEVIGNHNGTDELWMRDMPDLVIQESIVRCIYREAKVRRQRRSFVLDYQN